MKLQMWQDFTSNMVPLVINYPATSRKVNGITDIRYSLFSSDWKRRSNSPTVVNLIEKNSGKLYFNLSTSILFVWLYESKGKVH